MSLSLRTPSLRLLAVLIGGSLLNGSIARAEPDTLGAKVQQIATSPWDILEFNSVKVTDALKTIARDGHIAVVLNENVTGVIMQLRMVKPTPEEALQRVAEVAGLGWQRSDNGVYRFTAK